MEGHNKNIYSILLGQHRRDAVTSIRKVEKKNMKLTNWINHRIFNIRCQRANITPTSLKIKISDEGIWADRIIYQAQRKLLNNRIYKCDFYILKIK